MGAFGKTGGVDTPHGGPEPMDRLRQSDSSAGHMEGQIVDIACGSFKINACRVKCCRYSQKYTISLSSNSANKEIAQICVIPMPRTNQ